MANFGRRGFVGGAITDRPEADTRPHAPTTHAAGTRLSVEWYDDGSAATILRSRLGVHHVHDDDFDDVWDEWVSLDRIRLV